MMNITEISHGGGGRKTNFGRRIVFKDTIIYSKELIVKSQTLSLITLSIIS